MSSIVYENHGRTYGGRLTGRVLIGRKLSHGIVSDDPGVSRLHAWIDPVRDSPGRWILTDAGSKSGTRVDGEAVATHELKPGDVIAVGPLRIRFDSLDVLDDGVQPVTLTPPDGVVKTSGVLFDLPDGRAIGFDPEADIVFRMRESLPQHPNGLRFTAWRGAEPHEREFYSVGGGFIVAAGAAARPAPAVPVPHPFTNSAELLAAADGAGLSIAALMRANEASQRPAAEVSIGIARLWDAMRACIERGQRAEGELPGGLRVRRRAPGLMRALQARAGDNLPDNLAGMDWVNLWALAVNEENAAGGRVVTAPTNGAAGIVPAVLTYYDRFVPGASRAGLEDFFLAAAAVGAIIKRNASISGAEVGCQGEVGSACAMAAAGLAAAMGASNGQVENAAEIALEHNLGLTCDPIAGLVQVPCIERNAIGAVKAINAARLAMHGDGSHLVSLDQVVRTMRPDRDGYVE